MMTLKMPKDLDNVKTNLIGPFSLRQIIGLGFSAGIVFVVWTFLKDVIPSDFCIGICTIVCAPFLAIGFLPPSMMQGLYAEQFVWLIVKYNVLRPVRRKYKTVNFHDQLRQEIMLEEKARKMAQIKARTKAEKKAAKKFNNSLKGIK